MAERIPQPIESVEEIMSLLNDFARPCVLMEKHREPDGAGGYVTTWTEGAAFSNYQALDTSMQAVVQRKRALQAYILRSLTRLYRLNTGTISATQKQERRTG